MSTQEDENVQSNDIESQIEELKNALNSNPNDVTVLSNLGACYASINKFDEAIEMFNKILELDQKNYAAHKALGVIFAQMGKLEDAINKLKIAVKLNSDNPNLWNNLSEAYRRAKNFHQSNVARMRAIQLIEQQKT
ncbi:MAG: tetratricopeptide repeat protein [Candidatus Helarchaeota archaeon]